MTVISQAITDIAGTPEVDSIRFATYAIRESAEGTALVTTKVHTYQPDEDGVLTTGDLDPGPAKVMIGARAYAIEIPDSATPIQLWPLIEAALPVPISEEATAVRNGGGFARGQVMTAAEYSALTSVTTPDPGSMFFVY
ncbi:hypothetical protein NDR87_31025 [Nocardia sp. CDC159]|uniref:Uncharacterized protein n=1 Tax=Nocardia pulmonis TaxID=2951408 RepID=A0A9X2J2G6_9NOCA|nr:MULTISPECIES: hypothetical protein [Nocardia]MCM6778016.1 hypothetical protein [Nocardia pulmonis]MCM6790813.1 hypothetical protein [Nocardia sp. CDC159]